MHYNWHRHYDASLGRYTQPYPLGFVDGPSVYGYARGSPYRFVDPAGLFGDGLKEGDTSPGHSDFIGGDEFDYTLEDHGYTSPYLRPWRHFRNLPDIERDLERAISNCDRYHFRRYMHQGQDYWVHYRMGYRAPLGHLFDGHKPDLNLDAWNLANLWTYYWLRRWEDHCGKKCSKR